MSILSTIEEILICKIKVDKRLRNETGNLNSLCKSIKSIGLLHPIVVTQDYYLVAGLRRLEAAKRLGWDTILVRKLPFNHEVILFE